MGIPRYYLEAGPAKNKFFIQNIRKADILNCAGPCIRPGAAVRRPRE